MRRYGLVIVLAIGWAADGPAAPPPVGTASGVVKKATANVLLIVPRGPDGRFGKTLTLKLSGTSKVTTLGTQTREGRTTFVQRDTEPARLQPNQGIAVIYTVVENDTVLLSAVAQPAGGK